METAQTLVLHSCMSVSRILGMHCMRRQGTLAVVHPNHAGCKGGETISSSFPKICPAMGCMRVGAQRADRRTGPKPGRLRTRTQRMPSTLLASLENRRNLVCGHSSANHGLRSSFNCAVVHRSQGAAEMVVHCTLWRNPVEEFKRGVRTEAWLGRRNEDGDWQYSPEWWGTQGGSWGRDAGETVFESSSAMGNGVISVTSHPASTPRAEDWAAVERELQRRQIREGGAMVNHGRLQVLGYEWRVLRFNTVTRQSVAKVMAVSHDRDPSQVFLVQQPNCVAFEYVKSIISAGLSTISLAGFNLEQVIHGTREMRILCVGLGGGSLPLFLAHSLPGATLDVVEIDGVVIKAAIDTMGFPPCHAPSPPRPKAPAARMSVPAERSEMGEDGHHHGGRKADVNAGYEHGRAQEVLWGSTLRRMTIYEADGEAFVVEAEQQESKKDPFSRQYYDMVFVDAYDGDDVVPTKLWARNGSFLTSLNRLLHPKHGTVVVNLHTDAPPPSLLEKATGQYGPGFDPHLPQGRRVQEACWSYRDALLSSSTGGGVAFTVAVPLQGNISLVVSRGLSPVDDKPTLSRRRSEGEHTAALAAKLRDASKHAQKVLDSSMDFSKRVSRGFQVVQDRVKATKVH